PSSAPGRAPQVPPSPRPVPTPTNGASPPPASPEAPPRRRKNRGNPPKGQQETQNNPTLSAQTAPQRRSHSTQNSSDHRQPTKISSPFEKCGLGTFARAHDLYVCSAALP